MPDNFSAIGCVELGAGAHPEFVTHTDEFLPR
jgi:hypothetical protein